MTPALLTTCPPFSRPPLSGTGRIVPLGLYKLVTPPANMIYAPGCGISIKVEMDHPPQVSNLPVSPPPLPPNHPLPVCGPVLGHPGRPTLAFHRTTPIRPPALLDSPPTPGVQPCAFPSPLSPVEPVPHPPSPSTNPDTHTHTPGGTCANPGGGDMLDTFCLAPHTHTPIPQSPITHIHSQQARARSCCSGTRPSVVGAQRRTRTAPSSPAQKKKEMCEQCVA